MRTARMVSAASATLALLAITTAGAVDITLYEHDNYRGRSVAADRSITNLANTGFNDMASSAVIRNGTWQLCTDAFFRGSCVTLAPGDYDSLRTLGLNDRVSSAREVGALSGPASGPPTTGSRGSIELYGQRNFAGRSVAIDTDISNLESQHFNDRARSAIVHEGQWQLCEHADFRGSCETLGPGRYPGLGVASGQASSLRSARMTDWRGDGWGSGARAVLYDGRDLTGRSFVIDREVASNLARSGFNDRASSLRVEAGYWVFCSDRDFQGTCRTFGPGDYPTLPPGLNNGISSGRRIHERYPYGGVPAWQSPVAAR